MHPPVLATFGGHIRTRGFDFQYVVSYNLFLYQMSQHGPKMHSFELGHGTDGETDRQTDSEADRSQLV